MGISGCRFTLSSKAPTIFSTGPIIQESRIVFVSSSCGFVYRLNKNGSGSFTGAEIVGAWVILFDPIFQGLAISLMAGEVASLLLSRMAVPVLYYMARRRERAEPALMAAPMEVAS